MHEKDYSYDEDENNTKYASDLSEHLLTEGLNHRQIRNVADKIAWLRNDDQIVAEIVRQFCPRPSTTTPTPTTTTMETKSNYLVLNCFYLGRRNI